MNDVHGQTAGFVHVHLTDNQLYDGSCVGTLVQLWWSDPSNQTNPGCATLTKGMYQDVMPRFSGVFNLKSSR